MSSEGWEDAWHQLSDAAAKAEGQARFELLTAAAYAADNTGWNSPPFYVGPNLNVAMLRAGLMAKQDPSLLPAFVERYPQHSGNGDLASGRPLAGHHP